MAASKRSGGCFGANETTPAFVYQWPINCCFSCTAEPTNTAARKSHSTSVLTSSQRPKSALFFPLDLRSSFFIAVDVHHRVHKRLRPILRRLDLAGRASVHSARPKGVSANRQRAMDRDVPVGKGWKISRRMFDCPAGGDSLPYVSLPGSWGQPALCLVSRRGGKEQNCNENAPYSNVPAGRRVQVTLQMAPPPTGGCLARLTDPVGSLT